MELHSIHYVCLMFDCVVYFVLIKAILKKNHLRFLFLSIVNTLICAGVYFVNKVSTSTYISFVIINSSINPQSIHVNSTGKGDNTNMRKRRCSVVPWTGLILISQDNISIYFNNIIYIYIYKVIRK